MSTLSASEKIISGIAKLNAFAFESYLVNDLVITVKAGGASNTLWFNVRLGKWWDDSSEDLFTETVDITFDDPGVIVIDNFVSKVLAKDFLENLTAIGNE